MQRLTRLLKMPLTGLICSIALGLQAVADSAPPKCADALVRAYPGTVERDGDGIRVLKGGATFACGDVQIGADPEWRLAHATLADQVSQPYPGGSRFAPPRGENDPGRLRHIPFFKAMYGESEAAVRANLVPVAWIGGGQVTITRVNGADRAIAQIAGELARLAPSLKAYVDRPAGTMSWRPVAGTEYLSAHSFGIAIDINIQHADYWYWDRGMTGAAARYRNRIPWEIVEIFERHGFIWGGKWAHYDTMHFEFRPELLPPK